MPDITTPIRSSTMTIEDGWIDYNGHLNMAYYNVLFDRAVDELHELVGLGPSYRKRTDHTTFTAEAHIVYLREIHAGDKVHVTIQLVDADAKRHHVFMELIQEAENFVSANSEQLHLHVDLGAKAVVPFPGEIHEKIEALRASHQDLARPADLGRVIGIRRQAPETRRPE